MSHHEISNMTHRIELQKFGSELSSGLPLMLSPTHFVTNIDVTVIENCLEYLLKPRISKVNSFKDYFNERCPINEKGFGKIRFYDTKIKWGASSRWPFGRNPAWGSIETTATGKTHPTISIYFFRFQRCYQRERFLAVWW